MAISVARQSADLACSASDFLLASAVGTGRAAFLPALRAEDFDPLKVEDDASVAIRYLTGGVLVRMNRQTQALEPELAQSWKVSKDGKQITFKLRSGISFSDGTPFSAEDVAYTVQQLMDPSLHSANGRRIPLRPGKCRHENPFADADFDHVSGAGRRTRPAIRSGRDPFGTFGEEGNGRARAVHGRRLQARIAPCC